MYDVKQVFEYEIAVTKFFVLGSRMFENFEVLKLNAKWGTCILPLCLLYRSHAHNAQPQWCEDKYKKKSNFCASTETTCEIYGD